MCDLPKISNDAVLNYIQSHIYRFKNNAGTKPTQRKRDMKFGTWNVRSQYGSGSPSTVAREPPGRPRHRWKDIKVDLQEVRWGAWTGLLWLRIGTDGVHLYMR